MRRRQFILLAGVTGIVPPEVRSSTVQESGRFDEIAKLISAKMAEHHIPGVAFGVLKNGQITARGVGVTNVDDPQPVTPETVFPIASISKTVAATALMTRVRQGRVDLKSPVRRYLPEFRVQDEIVSREVMLWHLLTHTPGWEGQLTAEDRGTDTLNFFTAGLDRKSTRLNSSHSQISYAVFCLKKKIEKTDCAETGVKDDPYTHAVGSYCTFQSPGGEGYASQGGIELLVLIG